MAVTALQRKARPTNADVMAAIVELHDCVHIVDGKVDTLGTEVGHVKERVARVEGYQQGFAAKFNIPPPPAPGVEPPRLTFWQRHRNPLLMAGGALGFLASVVAAYPLLRVMLLAADAYMVKAGAK
jgi:hypothetical protein